MAKRVKEPNLLEVALKGDVQLLDSEIAKIPADEIQGLLQSVKFIKERLTYRLVIVRQR